MILPLPPAPATRSKGQPGFGDDSFVRKVEDSTNLEALRIGPLDDQIIRIAGLNRGGLPYATRDGWTAERLALQWPEETLVLVPPGSWIYGLAFNKPADFCKVFVGPEVREWGFSPTGRSLVLATSGDLMAYTRPSAE